jgi:N-acetylglucosaminyl-diphospho-decaprenol L-rhamnosyltransferase
MTTIRGMGIAGTYRKPRITISVVSHGQLEIAAPLLADLAALSSDLDLEVFLKLNIPERPLPNLSVFSCPITVLENSLPRGFGANHNEAFTRAQGEWFCVLNPDIRLPQNPFPVLLEEASRLNGALIAPSVLSDIGEIEDSVRHFPTLSSMVSKLCGFDSSRYVFPSESDTFCADWVAGMFMLFRSEDFRLVGGFDEKFYLYYEDVDICARLWKAGRPVLFCPSAKVVHNARRSSRTNPRYMRWHAASMLRYFVKHWGRLPKIPKNLA